MENKINVAEILKDCPKGMALNCTMFENLEFERINKDDKVYPIICRVKTERGSYNFHSFNIYGCYNNEKYSKCVIFPKGKTTWEGFQRPFKDGDIIFTHANCLKVGVGNTWISIYQENRNGGVATYVDYAEDGSDYYSDIDGDKALLCMEKDILRQRLATEEEKQKLFDAIKANGYKWNEKTKTLEKLPKFKVGDRVVKKDGISVPILITGVGDEFYYSNTKNSVGLLPIAEQDDWELVPNKFDITTLVPLESKVLVRNVGVWLPAFWGYYSKEYKYPFVVDGGNTFAQCIPYEGNEYLLGTTNDCDKFYKTWE